jgi:hypothetical protein
MVSARVCRPLAANPWKSVSRAASSSRWNGCGSNSAANVLIRSLSIRNRSRLAAAAGDGDLPSVASSFLTLCERAIEHYPADAFVGQIAAVLANQSEIPVGWRGSTIPSRIAALVHEFAQRTLPLPPALAQGMLRILDKLVDMGDRRSAALQTSEIFREVAVAQ